MFRNTLALIVLAAGFASAAAVPRNDDRLLITKPACMSMDNFELAWNTVCPVYRNSSRTGEQYSGTFFRPGDYQGKNNDTQALVFCKYTAAGGSQILYTKELMEMFGAQSS